MPPPTLSTRAARTRDADLCPGVLQPFEASDGTIVRLRVPGGEITTATLQRVMDVALRYGAPFVQLTSRAALQIRALPEIDAELIEALWQTGLLPSRTHERVRNIVASPLSPPLRGLAREFDTALCADPELAGLPGRFWFGFDDTGHLLREPVDVLWHNGTLRLGGQDKGLIVSQDDAIPAMMRVAHAFLALHESRSRTWQLREMNLADLGLPLEDLPPVSPVAPPSLGPVRGVNGNAVGPEEFYWDGIDEHTVQGDAVVGLPLGRLTPDALQTIAYSVESPSAQTQHQTDSVVLTPWRRIVIPGGAAHLRSLSDQDLIVSETSPWAYVSACTGHPGCAHATFDTTDLAHRIVADLADDPPRAALPIHVTGCDRRCGTPAQDHHAIASPESAREVLAVLR